MSAEEREMELPERSDSVVVHEHIGAREQQQARSQGSFRTGSLNSAEEKVAVGAGRSSYSRTSALEQEEKKEGEDSEEDFYYSDSDSSSEGEDEDGDDDDEDDDRFDRKREVRRYGYAPTTMLVFEMDDPIRTFCVLLANDGRFKK